MVVLQILWRGVSKACHPSRKNIDHLVHDAILDDHAEKKVQNADTWSKLQDRILEEQKKRLEARNLSPNLPSIVVIDKAQSHFKSDHYNRPPAPANTFFRVTFCPRTPYKRAPAWKNTFLGVTFCPRTRYKRPPAPSNTFLRVTFCSQTHYKWPPAPANTFWRVTFCPPTCYKRPPALANRFLRVTFCPPTCYERPPATANTFLHVTFCPRTVKVKGKNLFQMRGTGF